MSNNTKPRGKRRDADDTASKERQLAPLREHAFKPGQSGNPKGRPKGARNRLGTQFLEALEADFNQFGPQAIALVREKKPEVYMRVAKFWSTSLAWALGSTTAAGSLACRCEASM